MATLQYWLALIRAELNTIESENTTLDQRIELFGAISEDAQEATGDWETWLPDEQK